MQAQASSYTSCFSSKKILTAAAALACFSAHAENWPLSLSIIETLSRDNNLYRAEPGQYAIADTVSTTGLKLALDKLYGRQHYSASFGAGLNRYIDSDQLNNASYDLSTSITSEFADKGLIRLTGGATQNLARFDVANGDIVSQAKNTQNTSQVGGQLSYGGYGALNPYFSYSHFQQGFTYTNNNYQAINQNTYSLGTYYAPVPQLSLGLGGRFTKGDVDYDQGSGYTLTDQLQRRDFDLSASWVVTGLTALNARLSATRTKDKYENAVFSGLQSANSRGTTGEVNWQYTPQGRLEYQFGFSRDTGNLGQGSSQVLENPINGEYITDKKINTENNRLSNNLNGKITWDLSYKLKINTTASYTQYKVFKNTDITYTGFSLTEPSNQSDTSRYTQFSLGGKYQYARWLDLYCEIKRMKRTEDIDYRPYNATVTSCTGQFNINGMN